MIENSLQALFALAFRWGLALFAGVFALGGLGYIGLRSLKDKLCPPSQ